MGRGKKWSKSDINYLDEYWGKNPLAYLSKRLKRTEKAVVLKAKRLKLGASTRADEYLTANQVSVLLNVDCHTVLRWVKKCNLEAVEEIMLYKRKFYLIKHRNLCKWLKNNQDRFDSRKIELFGLGHEPLWLQEKRKRDRELPKERFKKWTDFEIQRIIIYSKNMKYKEIAKLMNRSHRSIEKKFSRLQYRQRLLQRVGS